MSLQFCCCTVRNGFKPERIEQILHKIELGQKHQAEKFGLNLGIVSNSIQAVHFVKRLIV